MEIPLDLQTIDLEKVRAEIRNSGRKNRWIAEKIGVEPSTVTKFLGGHTRLGKPAMILLLQTLELKPEMLKTSAS